LLPVAHSLYVQRGGIESLDLLGHDGNNTIAVASTSAVVLKLLGAAGDDALTSPSQQSCRERSHSPPPARSGEEFNN
jgi:hypothetical protein